MAIMNETDIKKYDKIQEIIVEVLENRKTTFTKETIIEVIKKRLVKENIDATVVTDIYFNLILDGTLNNMIDSGIIYNEDRSNTYDPLDYIIYHKYLDNDSRVLYLKDDDGKHYNFINIASGVKEHFPREFDYILTGGIKNNRFVPSSISYEEIKQLYDDCVKEGASRREALEHILNFYSIRHLFNPTDDYMHTVDITRKRKKEFSRVLKKNDKRK